MRADPRSPRPNRAFHRSRRIIGAAACLALVAAPIPFAASAAVAAPVTDARPAVVGLTISDMSALLDAGQTTSVALVEEYQARIAAYENAYGSQPGINAIIAMDDDALAQAAALDAERAAGHIRGPLHGVPIVVKDNFDTADMPTTAGSASLADFQTIDDATQVERLRAAGAIIIAKTNMSEFAWGYTGLSSQGGQTRNPYDQTRVPGGSSAGTGAAVAASFAAAGLGSDTCGSIRVPAAENNLVGLRPTLGLSSRDGVAPMSTTQDTAGPLAQSVTDVALILDATVGYDPKDPSTADSAGHIPETYTSTLTAGALAGKTIGLVTNPSILNPTDGPTVTDVVYDAAAELRAQGATVVEVTLPDALLADVSGSSVLFDEFTRELNTWLAQPGATFSAEVAALTAPADVITLDDIVADATADPGTLSLLTSANARPALPNAAYDAKLDRREVAQASMVQYFSDGGFDALAYPSVSREAVAIGAGSQTGVNCSLSANLGFPAISMPAGFTEVSGMPVGLELLGLPYTEPELLGMAYDYELGHPHRVAPASVPELAGAKAFSSVTVSAPPIDAGQPAAVEVAVSATLGRTTDGTVTLTGAGEPRTATVENGVASFALGSALAAGNYALVASYSGTDTLHGSEVTADLTVRAIAVPPVVTTPSPSPTATRDTTAELNGASAATGGALQATDTTPWYLLPLGVAGAAALALTVIGGRRVLRRSERSGS
jgi:amidase